MMSANELPDGPSIAEWATITLGDNGPWSILRRTDDGLPRVDWADTPGELERYVSAPQNQRGDRWVSVAARHYRLAKGRGTQAECRSFRSLWSDLDIEGPGHKTDQTLFADAGEALSFVRECPLPPTSIVHTGGGVQPWWSMHEDVPADESAELLERWGQFWIDRGRDRGIHVDSVFDLPRVMRLPGTVNAKAEPLRPVRIIEWAPDRLYNPSDFDWLPPLRSDDRPTHLAPVAGYIGPERPGDAFIAQHTCGEILARNGWTFHSRSSKGDEHWTRPGKERRKGSSATVYAADGRCHVFTDLDPKVKAGESLNPFRLLAKLEYGGDFSATTRALVAAGYGTSRPVTITALPKGQAAEPPPSGDPAEDPWRRIDLAEIAREIRAGTRERIKPELVEVGDSALLYRGRVHSIFGPSGGGKTWVTLAAMLSVVRAGERVLMIDFEDDADGIAGRLVDLGVTETEMELIDYRNPDTSIADFIDRVEPTDGPWALVLVDSIGEAMSPDGVNSDKDDEVARWMSGRIRALTKLPGNPAVLTPDHVTKPKDDKTPEYAIGSQRKRAAINGASYSVETVKEPAIGVNGELKLIVAKDRGGARPRKSIAAIVHMESGDNGQLTVTFAEPEESAKVEQKGDALRNPHVMQQAYDFIAVAAVGVRATTIREQMHLRKADLGQALKCLVVDGHIRVEQEMVGRNWVRLYYPLDPPNPYSNVIKLHVVSGSRGSHAVPGPDFDGQKHETNEDVMESNENSKRGYQVRGSHAVPTRFREPRQAPSDAVPKKPPLGGFSTAGDESKKISQKSYEVPEVNSGDASYPEIDEDLW